MKTRNKSPRNDAQHMTRGTIVTEKSSNGLKVSVIPMPADPTIKRPVHELFMCVFGATVARLQPKESWNNGTGYFDGAVHDEELKSQIAQGDRGSFVDDFGRKAVVFHTMLGLAVVFERYSEPGPLVANMSSQLQKLVMNGDSGALTLDHLRTLLLLTQLSV